MTREIERRFLVERLPADLPEGTAVRQGYLAIVEVEFPSPEAAAAFEPPAWFGEEITGCPEWSNVALAVRGRPDGLRLGIGA